MKPTYRVAKVSDLKPHPKNPRKHGAAELAALEKSVKRFGFTAPIIVQKSTGLVLAGHARLEVLRKSGETEAPVIELDCNDKDAIAYMVADNQLTILGAWDFPMLEELVTDLKTGEYEGMDFIDDLALPLTIDFAPGTEDDQGKLDELQPKIVTCPHCGKEFDARGKV